MSDCSKFRENRGGINSRRCFIESDTYDSVIFRTIRKKVSWPSMQPHTRCLYNTVVRAPTCIRSSLTSAEKRISAGKRTKERRPLRKTMGEIRRAAEVYFPSDTHFGLAHIACRRPCACIVDDFLDDCATAPQDASRLRYRFRYEPRARRDLTLPASPDNSRRSSGGCVLLGLHVVAARTRTSK